MMEIAIWTITAMIAFSAIMLLVVSHVVGREMDRQEQEDDEPWNYS